MTQKNLTIIFFTLLILFGVLYYFYDKDLNKDGIKSFESSVSKKDSEDFQDFLYENRGKFVKLSVILSQDMVREVLKGMDEENRIIFRAMDMEDESRTIQYMIRVLDNGKLNFSFDKTTGKLSGFFKTNRRISPDGSPIVNLIPIPARLLVKN
jgi:hypothetical protein